MAFCRIFYYILLNGTLENILAAILISPSLHCFHSRFFVGVLYLTSYNRKQMMNEEEGEKEARNKMVDLFFLSENREFSSERKTGHSGGRES